MLVQNFGGTKVVRVAGLGRKKNSGLGLVESGKRVAILDLGLW